MKRGSRKILLVLIMAIFTMSFKTEYVYAAPTAKTSIESGTVGIGEEIVIKVSISSKQPIGTYNLYVRYDEEKLLFSDNNSSDYNGGGGQVRIVGGENTSDATKDSFELRFIGNKAGESPIAVFGSAYYFDESAGKVVDMTVKSSQGKIKVTKKSQSKADSSLTEIKVRTDSATGKSREVKLEPEFSPDITEYTGEVTFDVNELIVTANQSDEKANVDISGTKMDLGDNTTKIVVTADDGSSTEYVLHIKKTRSLLNDAPDEPQEETSTRAPKAEKNIYLEALDKYIIIDFPVSKIPEGFEESTVEYDNKTVNVARGISKNLVLMYLADNEEKKNGAFYIYDEKNDSFTRMANIQTEESMYTIVPLPKDVKIPKGFTKKKMKVSGSTVDVWVKNKNEDFCLVYAMNYEGESGLYVYDKTEKTLQRYIEEAVKQDTEEENSEEQTTQYTEEVQKLYDTIDDIRAEYKKDRAFKWKVIIVLVGVCIGLLLLVNTFMKKLKSVEIVEVEPDEKKEDISKEHEMVEEPAPEKTVSEEQVAEEPAAETPVDNSKAKQQAVEEQAAINYVPQDDFVQPAEMRIVDTVVFKAITGYDEEGNKIPEEPSKESDSTKDEEVTTEKQSAEEVVEIVDEEDDFEIEFFNIDE